MRLNNSLSARIRLYTKMTYSKNIDLKPKYLSRYKFLPQCQFHLLWTSKAKTTSNHGSMVPSKLLAAAPLIIKLRHTLEHQGLLTIHRFFGQWPKSGISDLKSDSLVNKSGLQTNENRKLEKIALCRIIGHRPLRSSCPSFHILPTYTIIEALGTADHVTLLQLF